MSSKDDEDAALAGFLVATVAIAFGSGYLWGWPAGLLAFGLAIFAGKIVNRFT